MPVSYTHLDVYKRHAQSRAEVEKIIGEDPFNAVADYRVIEFEPNKSVEGFKELLKIG